MSLEDEPSNRVRWLGAALILLALAALIWQASEAGRVDEPPPPAVVEAEAPEARPSLNEMLASVNTAKLGVLAASASAWAAPGASAAGQDEVEVCGIGRVKVDASGEPVNSEPITQASEKASKAALDRLLPQMSGSSDELTRSAALLLQMEASESRDALARMALTTQSPDVYLFALRACARGRDSGVCRMLSADQLARLDPNNVFPWLEVATDARARGDTAALAEAMYRASLSNRADVQWGKLTGIAMARLPTDTPEFERWALAVRLIGTEAAFSMPYFVVSQYCSVTDVRDSNRQQICSAVAEVLSSKGTNLMDLGFGTTIGQRAGWPAERVAALREEHDALSQVSSSITTDAARPLSCAALQKLARYAVDLGRYGELGVTRRALKQSPDNVASLARRYREATIKRIADSASGPASATSQ